MHIGVVFPQVEIGPHPAGIRDYAQAVEGMGYTHVLAFDYVLGANPERLGGWKGRYNTMGMGLAAPEDHGRILERFKKEAMG